MAIRKSILLGVATFTFAGVSLTPVANASYLNGNEYASTAHTLVKARKRVPVYKVRTGNCEANNHFSFYKYLKKGSKVYASRYFMSTGGWVIKSSHVYYHNSRTFFLIPDNQGHWYTKLK